MVEAGIANSIETGTTLTVKDILLEEHRAYLQTASVRLTDCPLLFGKQKSTRFPTLTVIVKMVLCCQLRLRHRKGSIV